MAATSAFSLRRVTPADVRALRQVSIDTFEETFAHLNSPADMAAFREQQLSEARLLAELNNPDSVFYFAEVDGVVAGFLKLNFGSAQTEPHHAGTVEIERIYVRKAFQGRRIGYQLYAHALAVAQECRAPYLWLGVWEHNAKAIAFYERLGFVAFGQHSFVLGSDVQTDLLMKQELAD